MRKRTADVDEFDALAEAFEAGRIEAALAMAMAALAKAPKSAEALHYRAACEVELGELDAAAATYQRALAVAPDEPELLLGAADLCICHPGEDRELLEQGLSYCGRGRKLAARADDRELRFEFLLLEGIAFNQLGECDEALTRLNEALKLDPKSPDAQVERAIALFELCRFEAAKAAFAKATAGPDPAWAHHYLGLIAERSADAAEAKRHFGIARDLAPEDFPAPVRLSDKEFDAAVEAAIARLSDEVKDHLGNTTVSVEELPSDDDLTASKPPLSPSILGVFRGTPIGERSVTSAADHFPAAIILYQRNLERFARTRDELIEQIGITLMHEVGHLLGLDEDDLWERGLE
jgi:predicted Zn-dependent protease with MMP-like domain/Flp pilus assembly protein TadD